MFGSALWVRLGSVCESRAGSCICTPAHGDSRKQGVAWGDATSIPFTKEAVHWAASRMLPGDSGWTRNAQ